MVSRGVWLHIRKRPGCQTQSGLACGTWAGGCLPGLGGVGRPAHTGARRPSLSATEWLGQDALDREQLTLDLKAARVPADAPAGVEHAMAGHDDRERI